MDTPDPGGVCDNGELRAAHSATGDQGSRKSAARREACDSQGKDANEEIKRPQERRFRTAGAAQTKASADRPPRSRRRGAPAWDGQGADHSGGDRRDSSPNLKVTAVALGQNQQKMEWRVENEFHICLVPPRWDPRRQRGARTWSPGGPSRPLRGGCAPRAAPQSRCRSPHPHRPGQQPSPGPGPMAAP